MAQIEIARYQFHSWARKGIASTIENPDDLGAGTSTVSERAHVSVPVLLNTGAISKTFALIGPGDIIGMNRDMVVRTQPRNWITDFEPNYLAFAEFYDEDFLWRYTPAGPNNGKLRPWLFLLVVKEDEFERTKRRTPLPSIVLKSKDVFPPAKETWLWAHVHNDSNIPDSDLNTLEQWLETLNKNVATDPDQLYGRLMSPRKLAPNTGYYAFVIPAFETGRLAGLGQSTDDVNAQKSSWSDVGANGEMPVYYEWFFRTGVDEDFESLVNKLKPIVMDPRVGIRDMDSSNPGFVLASDPHKAFPSTAPSILGLEGALKSPDAVSTVFPNTNDPNKFQHELEAVVNLPFQKINVIATDDSGDPIISIPLYGGKHAKKSPTEIVQLDITKNDWLNNLNKDPRTRVAAGFGTTVIQKNQETYMRKAWSQVQDIIAANKRIRTTVLYMKVSLKFTEKTFSQLQSNVLLSISRPILSRIMSSSATLYHQIKESRLPLASLSGTFRKVVSTGRRFSKVSADSTKFKYDKLITRLNEDQKLTAAPPKQTPAGVFTLGNLSGEVLSNPKKLLETISIIPARPGFVIGATAIRTRVPTVGDSADAKNYRLALTDVTERLMVDAPIKDLKPLPMSVAYEQVKQGIDPNKTFLRRLSSTVKFPGYIKTDQPEKVFPAMAYPDFEDPMYKKLAEISDEVFLPNLKLIANNSISLLKTNSKFIESYMVGLNHEMGRELLWREYPTDERGSYFRQFWDVSGIIAPSAEGGSVSSSDAEKYKDIKPIDQWATASSLGTHNNRNVQAGEQLVLTIRGDLLKKYAGIIIYAQKAEKDSLTGGTKIKLDLTDQEFASKVKFPLYKAEISPDIKFFGFDLTIDQAKGSVPSGSPADDLGWYFVLMQAPGNPTFGMDISFNQGDDGLSWDDLSWDKFSQEISFITEDVAPTIRPADPVTNPIRWGKDSASMAYILFQKPVMVAIHAKQMLDGLIS
ncbi:MAG: hypothetical protein ABJA70_05635 [Chryseolinea sp.]